MEEKNTKLLNKHCAYKRRPSCEGCRNHTKCVIFCLYLIAKRLVFLAKRNVLHIFQRGPRGRANKKGNGAKFVFALASVTVFAIFVSMISPFLEMESVEAGSTALAEEPFIYEVRAENFASNNPHEIEEKTLVKDSSSATTEVVTDVTEFVRQEVVVAMAQKEAESVKPEPMSRDEKLKKAVTLYDIPLDYDIDLAFEGMDYLVNNQNFTVGGAAGVMGNFYAECRFDSSEINGSHKGLAQWDSSIRWPMISEWLNANGYDLTSFHGQLEAIFYSKDANEFTRGVPYRTFDKMREASNPRDAAMVWLTEYERAPGQAESLRMDMAELTYNLYMSVI